MQKNSFTLFETIVSITLLAIVISGFIHSNTSNNNDVLFQKLNELENSFDIKDYSPFTKSNTKVTFIIDGNIEEEILVKTDGVLTTQFDFIPFEDIANYSPAHFTKHTDTISILQRSSGKEIAFTRLSREKRKSEDEFINFGNRIKENAVDPV